MGLRPLREECPNWRFLGHVCRRNINRTNNFRPVAAATRLHIAAAVATSSKLYLMPTTAIDKSGERVQRMFGEIAPHYDRMNHLLSLNIDRYWRWWTVKKLAPQAGEPILDVCTGTGD